MTAKLTGEPEVDEEDVLATGVALYLVLLGAHARGLASYWRTPALLRTPEGRAAVGIRDDERFVGLIHLGPACSDPAAKERLPLGACVDYLP